MVVDLAVAESAEQPLDILVRDRSSQPDFVGICDRHQHCRFVSDDPQMVEPAGGPEDGLLFDAFNDAETMVLAWSVTNSDPGRRRSPGIACATTS